MWSAKLRQSLKVIGIPVLVAFSLLYLFDLEFWQSLWRLMTVTFFLSLPYVVGALTIYLSPVENVRSWAYRILYPWIPLFVFCLLSIVIRLEGWACWAMLLPIFLVLGSLGGVTAGFFKLRKAGPAAGKLHMSIAVLLPFIVGPVEQAIGGMPGHYQAYASIDIEAPASRIWDNVTRVTEITEAEDQGRLTNFLQIPRPIRAELDFEGVGAKRDAIFAGGLVFNETVLKYEDEKMMTFSIKANAHDIPSTTFDEHIVVGGEFFDVLEGTYELEKLGNGMYRLHLCSKFKMTTTFNFYASLWGRWIMTDIQQNILKVIKKRSELSLTGHR